MNDGSDLGDDQERDERALVPQSSRGLVARSNGLVRRGLDDAIKSLQQRKSLFLLLPSEELLMNSGKLDIGEPPSHARTEPDPWGEILQMRARPEPSLENIRAKMEFVLIRPGGFMMGSDLEEDERPIHEVTISKPFYIGRYAVTQSQWKSVMGGESYHFFGSEPDYPVQGISWAEAQEYIRRVNLLETEERHLTGLDDSTYDMPVELRLPTEAEWEYACRAGSAGDYAGPLDLMAWFASNSGRDYLDGSKDFGGPAWWSMSSTPTRNKGSREVEFPAHDILLNNDNQVHIVGNKRANAFGLYDMHGNVWEWCQDFYDETYYRRSPATDPEGPTSGTLQVLRGGSWCDRASELRSARRRSASSDFSGHDVGFRVVAVASE